MVLIHQSTVLHSISVQRPYLVRDVNDLFVKYELNLLACLYICEERSVNIFFMDGSRADATTILAWITSVSKEY